MRYSSGFARYDHSVCVLCSFNSENTKWCIYNLNLYKTIPNTNFLQSSFDSPIFPIQFRQSNFYTPVLQSNYYNPVTLVQFFASQLRQSRFNLRKFKIQFSTLKFFTPLVQSNYTTLQNKRMQWCGIPPPPNNFRKT